MTNRIQDTYQIADVPQTQTADIAFIREILQERGDELSLENAKFVLAIGLRNRPDAWSIDLDELAELWPPAEHCPFCQSPLPPSEGYRTCPACGAKEDEPGCCDEPFFFKDDPDQGMVHYACLCGREQASDSYIDLHGPMSVPWGGV